jgi:thiamine biosynthesis protein ThiS
MPESFSFFGRDPLNLIRIMPAQGLGIMSKAAVSPKRDAVFYFMRLTINGEIKDNILATSLKGLLDELGVISGRVAVEVNTQVIKKTDYESFRLNDGDIVEIVSFVGGG